MSQPTPRELAETYLDAWLDKDFDRLRSILADDVSFVGALGEADGIDDCIAGLRGMSGSIEKAVVHARVADEQDVITWFDLYTVGAPPTPTANWSHVENGKITAIRVTFDPRPMLESA